MSAPIPGQQGTDPSGQQQAGQLGQALGDQLGQQQPGQQPQQPPAGGQAQAPAQPGTGTQPGQDTAGLVALLTAANERNAVLEAEAQRARQQAAQQRVQGRDGQLTEDEVNQRVQTASTEAVTAALAPVVAKLGLPSTTPVDQVVAKILDLHGSVESAALRDAISAHPKAQGVDVAALMALAGDGFAGVDRTNADALGAAIDAIRGKWAILSANTGASGQAPTHGVVNPGRPGESANGISHSLGDALRASYSGT